MLATPSLLGIKNDFFFWLMDTKTFNFMAKVSFWTYLIHYMVVEFVCYRQQTDFYYDVGDVLTLYVPITVISMFLGFLGTVLVENPFAKL
jgi:peptidoglycan/LPS O-acetylase OafA/YrhL